MILHLDDEGCLDPAGAGAKAAWLARGRQAGLPVLPGVVVTADASRPLLEHGRRVLAERGSGGARLVISQSTLPAALLVELEEACTPLGEPLVVRSSSILEGSGEWAGAFTSYLEVYRNELGKAVVGCWASSFAVSTLQRFEAAGVDPARAPMAVLVQPALDPDLGGTAHLEGEEITVIGVAGSPAPLVQGWDPGLYARVTTSGAVRGDDAIGLMGADTIRSVAAALRVAHTETGATSCEWAVCDGEVVLLQLLRSPVRLQGGPVDVPGALATEGAGRLARLVRRYPGPLGESLVLPWAMADPVGFLDEVEPAAAGPPEALQAAAEQARSLTAEVWRLPKPRAVAAARETLRGLRGSDPTSALDTVAGLDPPDRHRGRLVTSLLATVRRGLVEAGAVSRPELGWFLPSGEIRDILGGRSRPPLKQRIGFDRWEPFDASVVMSSGRAAHGTSAAPGTASGRVCFVSDPQRPAGFRPRDVVVASHPLPHLAPLLWDAAAIVTLGGSPAAHLFESARALAIPAVCGVHLEDLLGSPPGAGGAHSMAVDGDRGSVFVTAW